MPGVLAFDHPLEGSGVALYTTATTGESGEGVGEGHTFLVLILRDSRSCLAIRPSCSFI